MSDFKTHLAGGIVIGAGIAFAGLTDQSISPIQAGAVFVAGTIGGLLPDLDSDTGKPLFFLIQMISIMIPSLLFVQAVEFGGKSMEFIVCYFTTSYLLINYGLFAIVKTLTVHRGILHSIPFAALCGGLAYLLFRPSGVQMGIFAGVAVLSGALVHLILDEAGSIGLKYGFLPCIKSSSGSALKLRSSSPGNTLLLYSILMPVCYIVVADLLGRTPLACLR